MDRTTVDRYEDQGRRWAATRQPVRRDAARAFGASVAPPLARVDLGCGAGRYTADLGPGVIGLDAARAMLEQCRAVVPGVPLVQGDLEALPFGSQTLHGGWANMSYHHLPSTRLPMALADLHRALVVGAPVDLQFLAGDYEGAAMAYDDIGGRYFAAWHDERLTDVMHGAGFTDVAVSLTGADPSDAGPADAADGVVQVAATRARTLADTVGAGMRLLVVGLNPSLYAADTGVAFGRPGNRFWPAAIGAGLVTRDRDPVDALLHHGVGMTDLVKRATARADAVTKSEYRDGLARVDRLVRWLVPSTVCLVGLAGWRAAVCAQAVAGRQPERVGGRPVYVMPSTSGANAHASLDDLSAHLAAAWACAETADWVHEGAEPLH